MNNALSKAVCLILICCIPIGGLGCATPSGTVAAGMVVGAVAGAGAGHSFIDHGADGENDTRDTIITSVLFALLVGGALAWHYRQLEQNTIDISAQYSRYRLCDPDLMRPDLSQQMQFENEENGKQLPFTLLKASQIEKNAIRLDDNTKWAFPTFRKRYLLPERAETQVISERYIWEIIRPGSFVTRSENPDYFSEKETHK